MFWGFKFFILGFVWVGKFGKYFFGWLGLRRDFWGITGKKNLKIFCGSSLAA